MPELTYGERIQFVATVRRPDAPTNPGGMDYREHLRRQGILASASLPNREAILERTPGWGNPLLWAALRVKRAAAHLIDAHLPQRRAAVVKAILLGDRRSLTRATLDAFQRSGTVHLLVISGLNVAMVAAGVWLALRAVRVPPAFANGLVIAVVIFYAALTGMSPPVLRAAIMVAAVCFGLIARRSEIMPSVLALSVLIIAVRQPGDIFGASFQLSYAAVIGIVACSRVLRGMPARELSTYEKIMAGSSWWVQMRPWLVTWLRGSAAISAAAWAFTAPLLAHYFHTFTLASVPCNLVLVPLGWVQEFVGLVSITAAWVLSQLGSGDALLRACLAPLSWQTGLFEKCAQIGSKLPEGFFYVPGPGAGWVVVCYALLAAWVCREVLHWKTKPFAFGGLALAVAYVVSTTPADRPPSTRVTCFDTRHGLAVFVELPSGRNILYDCGTRHPFFDPGAFTVAPALLERRIRKIDLLVCSHADTDHVSGMPSILETFTVGLAIYPGMMLDDPVGVSLEECFDRHRVPHRAVARGDRISGFGDAEVEVLNPLRPPMVTGHESHNDASVVLAVRAPDVTVLLTGDVQELGISALASAGDLRADVLVLPHHGSHIDNIWVLVEQAKPRVVVVSAPDYLPSSASLAEIRRPGARVLGTWDCGCIDVWLGQRLRLSSFLAPNGE
jgi:competence protein ComEC